MKETFANDPSRFERLLLLGLLLLILGGLKLSFNPGIGRNSLDGDYYYQIARNVSEGNGLKTNLSLYLKGFKHFPHESNMAPLWPLALGYTGRIVGLPRAAALLPETLYLIDLLLLYFLANVLAVRMTGEPSARFVIPGGRTLDLGHVAVLLLGTNIRFFEFTSLPYTEALGFFFLLSALLALDRCRHGHLGWAAAAGLLAAAGFMTRAQLIGVMVAVPLALTLVSIRQRRFLALAATAVLSSVAAILPWAWHLSSFIQPFRVWPMINMGSYRTTPEIAAFSTRVPLETLWERFADRALGLRVAFSPSDPNSYLFSFGLVAWLPLLAIAKILSGLLNLVREGRALLNPRYLAPMATVLASGALLAPVHDGHFHYFKEWLFGFRHGLPLILLILPALVLLTKMSHRWLGWIAWGLVVASLATGLARTSGLLTLKFPSGLLGPEPQLVAWLDGQTPRPSVVTTNSQTLSALSRSGYHWITCQNDSESTLGLLEFAGANYVLLYPGEEKCSFLQGLEDRLELIKVFGDDGFQIGVLKAR